MKIFLQSVSFVFFIFSTFSSFAQSIQTCNSDLQCIGICSGPRDTTWVCKGETIRFGGTDSWSDCAYGAHESIRIDSRALTNYTVDRNGTHTCFGYVQPRITGPNYIKQETYKVPNDGGSCPSNFTYYIKAETVVNESGWYVLEWEHTVTTWNEGKGSYDVTIKKVRSSAYFQVKGGGAVPSFTVSKNKANVGEKIIVTPSVNYTFPNSPSNQFKLTTIDCNGTDTYTEVRDNLNPFNYSQNQGKEVSLFASALDNGCPTVKSGTQKVIFRPCGRESFGFSDAALEAQVKEVESQVCLQDSRLRFDYHFYALEKTLCSSSQCAINDVWQLYKSKTSNQAILAEDFQPQSEPQLIAPNIFTPPYNPNVSIISGTKINLYNPSISTIVFNSPVNNVTYEDYKNPIAIYVDESNRCVTNYTLKGHALYPGKVTRCLVEECGKIKVKTFGEGITENGSNSIMGVAKAKYNEKWGKILFNNVDNRFAKLVRQRYPQRIVENLNLEIPITLSIEDKQWIVKEFRIKHPDKNEVILFNKINSVGTFKDMGNAKMNFSTFGTYTGLNVENQSANGTWSTDGNTAITIDGANAQISSITADSFVVKGKMKSFVDTILVDADYTMIFEKGVDIPSNDLIVYFRKPSHWSTNVKIHYWNVVPNTNYPNTVWNGVSMISDGGDWYKFTFVGVQSLNFVINDGNGNQTADLSRTKTGYYANELWYDTDPRLPTAQNIVIYFKRPSNWSTNVKIHYWDALPNSNYPNTTWNGVLMTLEGNDWYKFTFTNVYSAYFVINDGGTNQTSDLLRAKTGWYQNSVWSDSDPTILPVELLNFTAIPLSKTTKLNWQTASEKNADHFAVQRSQNGKTFETLGQVKANGNSLTLRSYAFTDDTPFAGVNYYQLNQVDNDGKSTISNIVSLAFGGNEKLEIFPNPVGDKLTILSESNVEYVIFDAVGRTILRGLLLNNQTEIDVATLPSGVYLVKAKDKSAKFFKQ